MGDHTSVIGFNLDAAIFHGCASPYLKDIGMSQNTDNYINQLANFDSVDKRREQLIGIVYGVANALRNSPDTFLFSNIPGGFPIEVAMGSKSVSSDGNAWPSAQHIQSVLMEWHQAKGALEGAWSALSQTEKAAMKPPKFYRGR